MTIVDLTFHTEHVKESSGTESKKITYTWKGPQTGVVLISGELWRDADPCIFYAVTSALNLRMFAYKPEDDIIYMARNNDWYWWTWLYYAISNILFGFPKPSKIKYIKG